MAKDGEDTVLSTDALPPHLTYYYGIGHPNFEPFDAARGLEYQPNKNMISSHRFEIKVPASPVAKGLIVNVALVDGVVASSKEEYGLGPVGVALDSVAIFNPLARPGDDIDKEKFTFDSYSAHPTPDGTYHYHQSSRGPLEVLLARGLTTSAVPGATLVELFGIMCDGTLVLGCTELDGTAAPETLALDAQGGHLSDVKDERGTVHFANRYHTHVCPSRPGGQRYTPEIQYYNACGR